MLKQTGETGNDILEGLGQERRGNVEWKTLLYLLEYYFRMPPLESLRAVWIQCMFLYCVVHCTSHHGSSVVCKSSGPSSCLENKVQTFLWPQDPLSSASYWFFQSFHLHTSLGGNSIPNQPMTPTRLRMKMPALPSTRPHTNPAHSAQFLVPCWVSLIVRVPRVLFFYSILFAVQTSSTYQYILILVYHCFYEHVLYCHLYSKIRETRVCLPAQRVPGQQGLNSMRREVFQYLTQCLTCIKDLFQFSVPRNRSPKLSGENSKSDVELRKRRHGE